MPTVKNQDGYINYTYVYIFRNLRVLNSWNAVKTKKVGQEIENKINTKKMYVRFFCRFL